MRNFINMDDYRQHREQPNDRDNSDDSEALPSSFPVAHEGCFYGIAGEFAKAACVNSEADPVGVLAHALTYVGAYFGSDAALELGDVTAPPRLNCVTGGATGAGKGTAAKPVKRLMRAIADSILKTGNPDFTPVKFRDGPMSTGEGIAYMVRDESEKVDDKTGLPIDAGVPDKRLMIIEEEFGAVLSAAKREGNTISAAIRRLWDDGCYSPLIKKDAFTTTNAHVCWIGHITLEELLSKLASTEYTNGFANRVLWWCIRRPKVVTIPEKIPADQMQKFVTAFLDAIVFSQSVKALRMTDAALVMWDKVAKGLAKQKSMMSERARPQVLRLATIFALLDCTDWVRPEHIQAALHIWDFCSDSAAYIFDQAGNEEEEKIVAALRKHGGLSTSEITSLVFSNNIKSAALRDLLKSLESGGKIARSTRPPAGNGKKPATIFTHVA